VEYIINYLSKSITLNTIISHFRGVSEPLEVLVI
jgi:hypothetical protein